MSKINFHPVGTQVWVSGVPLPGRIMFKTIKSSPVACIVIYSVQIPNSNKMLQLPHDKVFTNYQDYLKNNT